MTRVLVVDDKDEGLYYLSTLLGGHGLVVDPAHHGAEALAKARQTRPDLVVSDLLMPVMDGYMLLSHWRADERLRNVPFVVYTATYTEPQDEELALSLGADAFIRKPAEPEELLARIQAVCANGVAASSATGPSTGDTPTLRLYNQVLIRKLEEKTHQLEEANRALRQDIDQLRLAERRISESEDRFAKVFHSSPVALAISGRSSERLIDVNEAYTQFFGYGRDRMVGRTVLELGLWDDPAARERLIGGLERPEAPARTEADFRHASGEVRHALVSMQALKLPGLDEDLVMVALVDITERKQLESQLLQAQKMEAVGRLAGGVAHDFNNVLGVILGYTGLLMRQANDVQRGRLEQIVKATQRASALTRQLLAFSRKQVVEPKVLDLNELVTDLEKMLGRLIGEDISLVITTDAGIGRVKADGGQLEQVVMNLCVNARDAMPEGGVLRIETADVEIDADRGTHGQSMTRGRYVALSVADTGCGIDAAVLPHIFEPFFTTKEVGKGTGLGLATVYGIVKQADGYVTVHSEVGRGTTFKIYLPRVDEPVSAAEAQRTATLVRGSETILLAEDEASLREITREILEAQGYRVLEASGADEAVAVTESHRDPIHLLITDVVMPGKNGRQLAEDLLATRSGLRVLYMSGYTDDVIARRGVLDPGTHLLIKPFTAGELLERVRTVLGAGPFTRSSGSCS